MPLISSVGVTEGFIGGEELVLTYGSYVERKGTSEGSEDGAKVVL